MLDIPEPQIRREISDSEFGRGGIIGPFRIRPVTGLGNPCYFSRADRSHHHETIEKSTMRDSIAASQKSGQVQRRGWTQTEFPSHWPGAKAQRHGAYPSSLARSLAKQPQLWTLPVFRCPPVTRRSCTGKIAETCSGLWRRT